MSASFRTAGVAVVLITLLAATACAQVTPNVPSANGATQLLTNGQIRNILLWRALQSRAGRGTVRRGVPQFMPYGNPWYMGNPADQQAAAAADAKKSEARAARIERLRQAREEAVAKREQAAKERAKARANANP